MRTTVENLYGVIADLQEGAPVLLRTESGLVEADVSWDYVIERSDGTWVETIQGAADCVRAVVIADRTGEFTLTLEG
jgi:hypothetical protein